MCGIAGVIQKSNNVNELPQLIHEMTQSIIHRGPDGEGVYYYENVGFGHRRLSILDLSSAGHQPMQSKDQQYVITYNGEIYNYLELRQSLEQAGYHFNTGTDTEVILAAYAAYGEECVKLFNGMWAFAILDKSRNIIFCSRDRFGIKPFYFIDTPEMFAFGSEIKQLLPLLKKLSANKTLLTDFILTGISDHQESSFFDGIIKLAAGSNLIYSLNNNHYNLRSYYQITCQSHPADISSDYAIDSYMQLFEDAIKLRLRSDVLVGTCLSGGLDSSSIASIAARIYQPLGGGKFKSITAISEQESNNEAKYAREVVDYHDLSSLQVSPAYTDFLDSLPNVVRTQEEPFGSPSITMQYFVMKTAREHGISVLLDGQGGDETLLGYDKYFGSYLFNTFHNQGAIAGFQALKAALVNNHNLSLSIAMKYLVGGANDRLRYFVYKRKHSYLRRPLLRPSHLAEYSHSSRNISQLQRLEIASTNLPALLRYEDKNSMAHSIEARLPFLDYRLVELALSLPHHYKINNGWSKWLLRKGMKDRMPESIVWRKNKLGFEAPELLWLRKHFNEMQSAVLTSPLLNDIANPLALRERYRHLDMRSQWRLYSIALWEKAFGVTS